MVPRLDRLGAWSSRSDRNMAERITICDRVFLGWTLGSTACLTAFSANYARGGDTERRRSALRTLRSVSHSPRRREVPDQEIWSNDLQLTVIVALDTLAASRHDASRPNGTAVGAMDLGPSLNC